MKIGNELTREEMKNVMAGSGSCRIYVPGFGWSSICISPPDALDWHRSGDASRYCCNSCGQGEFSDTASCSGGGNRPPGPPVVIIDAP